MSTHDRKFLNQIALAVFAIFLTGFMLGFFGGAHRAAKSARIIETNGRGYVIEYDYVGAHEYAYSN